jgi:hypothetical protein
LACPRIAQDEDEDGDGWGVDRCRSVKSWDRGIENFSNRVKLKAGAKATCSRLEKGSKAPLRSARARTTGPRRQLKTLNRRQDQIYDKSLLNNGVV